MEVWNEIGREKSRVVKKRTLISFHSLYVQKYVLYMLTKLGYHRIIAESAVKPHCATAPKLEIF